MRKGDSMPLVLEHFSQQAKTWIPLATLRPGDKPGSLADNSASGRFIYLFECKPDDTGAVVYRSKQGADLTQGEQRIVVTEDCEIVRELKVGQSWEKEFQTDGGQKSRVRFRHSKLEN